MREWLPQTLALIFLAAMLLWYLRVRRMAPVVSPADRTLVGVRGWLLLLCLLLVFFHPLTLLAGLTLHTDEQSRAAYPRLATIVLINSLVVLVLVAYSVCTGLRLWRVRPRAVANAKRFLVVAWIYFVSTRLALLMAGFPEEVNSNLLGSVLRQTPLFAAHILAWWMYLNRSRRVWKTYSFVEQAGQANEYRSATHG